MKGFCISENVGIVLTNVKSYYRWTLMLEQRTHLEEAALAAGLTVEDFIDQFTYLDELVDEVIYTPWKDRAQIKDEPNDR